MTEIRPIREAEASDFLRLLCDVFNLDLERASGVFYHEPMYDLRRKWALFDGGQMSSILTTVPLEFGWGRAIGIAGVATLGSRQGEGLASILLNHVLKSAEAAGEGSAWLFAKNPRLYTNVGFEIVDEVLRAPILAEPLGLEPEALPVAEVRRIYDAWSESDDSRLRRNERRWKYWSWSLRICTPCADGYLCREGMQVRECPIGLLPRPWRTIGGLEWFGLRSMSDRLRLPLVPGDRELFFMGRNVPGMPQIFMTDQF
jgi:predicted acetyltransferase